MKDIEMIVNNVNDSMGMENILLTDENKEMIMGYRVRFHLKKWLKNYGSIRRNCKNAIKKADGIVNLI